MWETNSAHEGLVSQGQISPLISRDDDSRRKDLYFLEPRDILVRGVGPHG